MNIGLFRHGYWSFFNIYVSHVASLNLLSCTAFCIGLFSHVCRSLSALILVSFVSKTRRESTRRPNIYVCVCVYVYVCVRACLCVQFVFSENSWNCYHIYIVLFWHLCGLFWHWYGILLTFSRTTRSKRYTVSFGLLCRSLFTYTQVSFDVYVGLFWHWYGILLTFSRTTRAKKYTVSFGLLYRSLFTYTKVSFDIEMGFFWYWYGTLLTLTWIPFDIEMVFFWHWNWSFLTLKWVSFDIEMGLFWHWNGSLLTNTWKKTC